MIWDLYGLPFLFLVLVSMLSSTYIYADNLNSSLSNIEDTFWERAATIFWEKAAITLLEGAAYSAVRTLCYPSIFLTHSSLLLTVQVPGHSVLFTL